MSKLPDAIPAPGSWQYEPSGDSDGFYAGIDHFVMEGAEEITCAPNQAYALLIAAAPDLLAACEDTLRAIGHWDTGNVTLATVIDALRAAVSKARGANAP